MFMDRIIPPINVHSISKNCLQNMTAETFTGGGLNNTFVKDLQ